MDRETALSSTRPTVADLTGDNHYAQVARKTWLTKSKAPKVLPKIVQVELWDPLEKEEFPFSSLLLLEQLQAFEKYLWPGYTDDASNYHVLLLALLVNAKRRESLPVWSLFEDQKEEFSSFFRRVLSMTIDRSLSSKLRTHLLTFVIGAFQSLDSGVVRKECAPLVSIGTLHNLHSDVARDRQLAKTTQLQKAWRVAAKRFGDSDAPTQARLRFERSWLCTLLLDFLDRLYDTESAQRADNLAYCERFMELLCDLQSQLPTRRYVNTLIQDLNTLPAIRMSPMYAEEDSGLLRDMYELLRHYTYFPIDDHSGRQLGIREYDEVHQARVSRLQKVALMQHPDTLKVLVLSNYGSLVQREDLESHLKVLTDTGLVELCSAIGLRTSYPEKSKVVRDRAFVTETLLHVHEREPTFQESVRGMTILPTEQTVYEPSLLRNETYDGERPLAIPKLNLQYLTMGDFLWRSFILYRCEAFYEIRKHVEDVLKRLQPRRQAGTTMFDGLSKLAIPIQKPAVTDTLPPKVGELAPAEVKAEVLLDVGRLQPGIRREWEALRPDDVVYLLAVQPSEMPPPLTNGHRVISSADRIGLKHLRCAEVIQVLDENGRTLRNEVQDQVDGFARPKQRRLLLRLDAAAYKEDKERVDKGRPDVYESINLVVRRRGRENNFKPVLESIKRLTLSDAPAPAWFQEVFLGYGDPSSATYKRLANRLQNIDYRDSFLDWQHLVESFPGTILEPDPNADSSFPPPYVLEMNAPEEAPPAPRPTKKRRRDQADGPAPPPAAAKSFKVSTYKPLNTGPYLTDAPKLNTVRFTPKQIEAITSGTQPGLTLIVGPPGTGKTDVATQIINNIYHDFPQQRTLLVAHSNQALNQLFQKIIALDIDERHLLRLGHGEEELETDSSYSKFGRVESFRENGARYLAEVSRLAASIGAPGAHGQSCETAEYFEQVYVKPTWTKYWGQVAADTSTDAVIAAFPFYDYFATAPQPLFQPCASRDALLDTARGCERHIAKIFSELADIRPFEILRSQRDKANYLLVKEARIVAMTSTHAAMRRHEIASLGFHYDNVIMEEAAQITETETFIPFSLQEPRTARDGKRESQLQRIVLVGDHLQNSPVVQNAAFRSYANLEQSLFLRLIRLGVPHILLDAQGRARPSLAQLYSWRYPSLSNLPITSTDASFTRANAGLRYDYQFIDVPAYKGQGETEPTPHFIQNLGEAEYAVALYMYLRLLGYPAQNISVVTTYAGQRALLSDVLMHRCKGNRLFGMPGWVGTVDKYQGEQNDYVILSLVRTSGPGFLRDLRRLTVALSRARLGLYVFGRREVFETSLELREAFKHLLGRSEKLTLVTGEMYPAARSLEDEAEAVEMQGVEHLGQYVFEMTQAKVKALKDGGGVLPPPATGGAVDAEDGDGDGEIEAEADGLVDSGDEGDDGVK